MIAYLEGKLKEKSFDRVIVDVNGVGYELFVSATSLNKLPEKGKAVSLHTFFYVREELMQLYGFATEDEKDLFEKLLSIPGIGPKLALSILSVFSVPSFKKAILASDVDAVTAIPGIGRKSAQRLIIELREKLALPVAEVLPATLKSEQEELVYSEVKNALLGLGYTAAEAKKALEGFPLGDGEVPKAEEMLKYALRNLANI